MNGTAGTTTTSLGSSAYSFFLNIVVLNQVPPASAAADPPPPKEDPKEVNIAPSAARGEKEEETSETSGGDAAPGGGGGGGGGGGSGRKSLLDGMAMHTQMASSLKSLGPSLDKSLHNTMKAVSKRSSALSDKAAKYVAGKTMIGRASAALDRALPEVAASAGRKLGLTIGRRFQQGPVIVLQVDLKAAGLPAYVEEVRGEDAAEHYRCAVSSLRLLGAEGTVQELEREMLPVVRAGLMERMSEAVVRTMKEKDESGAPLEVECIALEEKEEARWLFTYMEFQTQMK